MSADLLRRAALHLRGLSDAGCGAPWDARVADWLDSAARDAEEIGPDPHALAVARAVLREPEGGETS